MPTLDPGFGIDLRKLSSRQLDGFACCRCGGEDSAPMVPIVLIVGAQMFVHAGECPMLADAGKSAA